LAFSLAAQTQYDLVLKGGRVIDPKNRIDSVMDVAIANGRIARVANGIPNSAANKVIELKGLYVTPGLIDIHTHLYSRYVLPPDVPQVGGPPPSEGVDPDGFSFRSGVTTMVDAGSTGWREFPDFRDRIINKAQTRVLAFLNIVGTGMLTGREDDPAVMDAQAAARMAKANRSIIVGFKSAQYKGPAWYSVDNAVAAGNLTGLPVMVDFGLITPDRNIKNLFLNKLRPGDIYTHCFSGHREEVLANGELNPAMWAGRKRGIIFDIGYGSASFYWYVAVPAYRAEFYPDSVSTDLHKENMNSAMQSIDNVMSELMNLGSSFASVVRMATWAPAQEIRRPQLGNLDVGSEADVAVLRVEQGHFGFLDCAGARNPGTQRIVCDLTLRKGKVTWDRNGMAGEDWQKFQYRKGPFFENNSPATATRTGSVE
jgi:dihydroorotase